MGKGIIRNRLKRLLREVCRLHQEQFRQGFDLIFIPRQKIKGISYRLVENHLLEICHKAKLLDKPFEVKGEKK
jgi:ribonuclease P protein component